MNYRYSAYTKDGSKKQGMIEADSPEQAKSLVQAEGLYVSELTDTGSSSGGKQKAGRRIFGASSLKNVTSFTRQMSVLISSGTPIVQSLEAVERQTIDPRWRSVLQSLRERVEEGNQLSDAMALYPTVFDDVYRAMIAAGESGGDFDKILARLSKLARQEMSVRNSITGAMVYPALLLTVAGGVLLLLGFTVLPRFRELFETLNTPIPASTAFIMAAAEFMKAYWWAVLGGLIAAAFGLSAWLRTPSGMLKFHTLHVNVPMFGRIIRAFKTAKIARVMGVLLEAKVPLLESLEIARTSAGNLLYESLIENAQQRVERGESMSDAFSGSNLVTPAVCEAIRNGEQTGRVGEVLMNLADIMDEDNDLVVRSLTSILEPLILSVLGVVVGIIALSLFLPLFDLTASTGAG